MTETTAACTFYTKPCLQVVATTTAARKFSSRHVLPEQNADLLGQNDILLEQTRRVPEQNVDPLEQNDILLEQTRSA